MMRGVITAALLLTGACASTESFKPRDQYPPDPWVKGYSDPQDCLGGEKLAAVKFALPDYPKKAFRQGRQGWVIVRLDVDAGGHTHNINIERALPEMFAGNARRAVEGWQFQPPADGALENCRVLLRYRFGKVTLGG